MRAGWAILVGLLAGATWAQAPLPGLSPDLRPLAEALAVADPDTPAPGQAWEAVLTLKQATPRMLVFADAFLTNAGGVTYQIAKWEAVPGLVEPWHGRRDVRCHVSFVVVEVRKADPYRTMPHVVARITGIQPLDAAPAGMDGTAP